MMEKGNKVDGNNNAKGEKISRKKAIKKVGYAAFSAATMMLLLNNPTKVHANNSPATPPAFDDEGWEW